MIEKKDDPTAASLTGNVIVIFILVGGGIAISVLIFLMEIIIYLIIRVTLLFVGIKFLVERYGSHVL